MTLQRYTGATPSNVAKDAKYSVRWGTGGDEIRREYRANNRVRHLLTTSQHPALVDMVNEVKIALTGQARGAFYINEFRHVLVPDGEGSSFYAGRYDRLLEFAFDDGTTISPVAPAGIRPGDPWPGPRVGVLHKLLATGRDIRYERREPRMTVEVRLSDQIGHELAAEAASRVARVVGRSGGRFYVNEAGELFAPPRDDAAPATYIGNVEDVPWFEPPSGYDR
jgi:hypothetical protein